MLRVPHSSRRRPKAHAAIMATVLTEPVASSSRQGASSAGFFVPLESLRGVAALIVVMYHALWLNPITSLTFFRNGALMVDFCFV